MEPYSPQKHLNQKTNTQHKKTQTRKHINLKVATSKEDEETLKSVTETALNIRRGRKDLISHLIG
jgi:hypothetical protein